MDGDNTIGLPALRSIGVVLRVQYSIPTRLPFRLYSLVEQLAYLTKEDDYLDHAVETMRLARHASSSSDKTRLLKLAEGWVDLAEKAHEHTRRPRLPTTSPRNWKTPKPRQQR
jgi:hypothetical protein